MSSRVQQLTNKNLISPPKFLPNNIHYEVMMGSIAYGVSNDTSDIDVYGFCIPPKDVIFPHLNGYIIGFGKQPYKFEQYQQHGIKNKDEGKEYDVCIYSIIKYFQLCMENNPNMVDSLFVPRRCVLHTTRIGEMVREKRKIFLHKGCWPKLKGYSYSQVHKMKNKNPEGKRKELIEKYNFDVKFGYHVLRLLNQAEQILTTGDLNLEQNREQLKSIRRGEWTEDQIIEQFNQKEKQLEELYGKSTLPWGPREDEIRQLLIDCLEEHYGNLEKCVVNPDKALDLLKSIRDQIENSKLI